MADDSTKWGKPHHKKKLGEYEVIELSEDEYVLPGIVDIHAHYRIDAFGSEAVRRD
ncbi:MAG: hypothetical protein U5K35_08225 [Rhodohalobacter sp.]|nr:hypothetical protein [Rhodohalobacter sp.]